MYTWIQRLSPVSAPVQQGYSLSTTAAHLKVTETTIFHTRERPISYIAQGPCYGLSPTHIPRVPSGKEDGPRKSVWDILLWQLGFLARQLFNLKLDSFGFSIIINAVLRVFSLDTWKTLVAFFVLLFLPVASALDNEVTQSPSHGSASRAIAWISLHSLVRILVGCLMALIVVIGGHLGGVVRILIGPLMGFTSVLWMTMRNDSAIRPEFSWM